MPDHGIRMLEGVNSEKLRKFFLSIAWRASVSSIKDSAEFKLSDKTEGKLKEYLLNDGGNWQHYPISLTQLHTKGVAHNHFPLIDNIATPNPETGDLDNVQTARIYLDGLVARIKLFDDSFCVEEKNSMFVGGDDRLLVSCIAFEASFQYENTIVLAYESYFGPSGLPN
jgi:hypothetical protein